MCGIVVAIGAIGRIKPANFAAAVEAVAHRGPDDSGIANCGTAAGAARDVYLGHRRLAIIDLSADGHQPMTGPGGHTTITFNGEIFNYRVLRRELEDLGLAFRTQSDTEVILVGYEAWGEAVVDRLIGQFAFAVWDARTESLFVARDRLGIKPLYYSSQDGMFACASELKSLAALSAIDLTLDDDALAGYLLTGYIGGELSIYRDIRKLEAGCCLRVTADGQIARRRYWDPWAYYQAPPRALALPEALEAFESLLADAVSLRLVSDVPIGAFLSGGVDSSLIVATMQALSADPVKTFTIAFEDAAIDESAHAQTVADHLGTDHHTLTVSGGQLFDSVARVVTQFDEPFADMSAIPTLALAALTREHVTVALSGDGGDELFHGYPTYRWMTRRERLRHVAPAPLFGALAGAAGALGRPRLSRQLAYLAAPDAAQAHALANGYWTPAEVRALLPERATLPAPRALATAWAHLDGRDTVEILAAADAAGYMIDDVLVKVDRATMAVALEARVPLLDHRIVEFAARLPLSLKFAGGDGKRLMREALYRRVPRALVERPKQGFRVPMAAWLRGPLHDSLRAVVTPARLAAVGLADGGVVSAMVDAHGRGRYDHSKKLWNLYALLRWHETHGAGRRES